MLAKTHPTELRLKKIISGIKINWHFHLLIFVIAFAIIGSRRPEMLFNAQFYAEDGTIWYAQAYNQGSIEALFIFYAGYFQTFPRLIAALAQPLPLLWAPLFFNLVAITVQVLPVNLIISERFSALIPSLPTRFFLVFLYLVLPNSAETHANITNSQWRLALLSCMIFLAAPSSRLLWRCFDVVIIFISSLTGPFCILLAPIAALRCWYRSKKWLLVLLAILIPGVLLQILSIVLGANVSRSTAPLGATPELFVKIIGGQVFLGTLIGEELYSRLLNYSGLYIWLVILAFVVGVIVIVRALYKSPLELRLFILFAALILGAGLISPQISIDTPQWQIMILPGAGQRYYFMPALAFITGLVWTISRKSSLKLKKIAKIVLAVMLIGIIFDYSLPSLADFNYKESVQKFEQAPQGTEIVIPIAPSPDWSMTLKKR